MKCGKCGKEVPKGMNFCIYCGTAVEVVEVKELCKSECKINQQQNVRKTKRPVFICIVVLVIACGCVAWWMSIKEKNNNYETDYYNPQITMSPQYDYDQEYDEYEEWYSNFGETGKPSGNWD